MACNFLLNYEIAYVLKEKLLRIFFAFNSKYIFFLQQM